MDAGCELHGYCSDVTRTWPVSGTYSKHQRAIYEIVLDAQRQCIEACRVGAKLRDVHHLSVRVLSDGLAALGLFPGLDSSAIAHNAYRIVYPHSVGEHPRQRCCSAAFSRGIGRPRICAAPDCLPHLECASGAERMMCTTICTAVKTGTPSGLCTLQLRHSWHWSAMDGACVMCSKDEGAGAGGWA